MRYFVDQGLFECSEHGKVKCLKLAKRLDKSMTSNHKMRQLIDKVRDKNHDSVMISHDDNMINHDKVMQDKIRIDKNRDKDHVDSDETTSDKTDFAGEQFARFWKNYPTKKAKVAAEKAFRRLTKGKKESQVRFWVDMILNYHFDCIEREEIGADKLHAATLINERRWEDSPEFVENFKQEWLKENANG